MARKTGDMIIVKYSPSFLATLKKPHVIIRKNFKERIQQFAKNPSDPQLNNHPLKEKYLGYRSIDITGDWRAIFEEIVEDEEKVAYFVLLGTHPQLYK